MRDKTSWRDQRGQNRSYAVPHCGASRSDFAHPTVCSVTPVTTFAGKTVAVFGLGGSGLASCRALAAGGAKVIACDDDPKKMSEAQREGFTAADLRKADWSTIAALVLAPGVPLTHPAPHWSAALALAAGVEV